MVSKLELVSDNANEVGDGFEVQSLNGVFTIKGDIHLVVYTMIHL